MESIAGLIAIYFIIWWITLFAVLPFGIRGQWEGRVVSGTEPGAPQNPQLWRKVIITSIVSAIIFAGIMGAIFIIDI